MKRPLAAWYRDQHGRLCAVAARIVGSLDLAEEVVQETFEAALVAWGDEPPNEPAAWLTEVAKNKARDRVRARVRREARHQDLAAFAPESAPPPDEDPRAGWDDLLRLFFVCCHPALAPEAQVALALRLLSGLTTEEIARAFLVPVPTMSQRLVRAKQKIERAGIPFEIPEKRELPERLTGVLACIYLVFNEGYSASFGEGGVRTDLADEALRLARLVHELLPDEPEPEGLYALLLLHDSRRDARVVDGELVLLDEQDRGLWDREKIGRALPLVESSLARGRPPGPYALQAAIAAVHAAAASPAQTDWRQIAALYGVLVRLHPSPVVETNAAVAVAMVDGPARGLLLLDAVAARGELDGYHLLHAARADLLRRLERRDEAVDAYRRALALVTSGTERRFLERRLREAGGG